MPRYKLIEAREKAGLTQRKLAELVGCERKAPNYWEAGTSNPRGYHCAKILDVLKDVLKDVLTEEDNDLFKNYPEGQIPQTVVSSPNNCSQLPTTQPLSPTCQKDTAQDRMDSSDSIDIQESEEEPSMDKGRRDLNSTIAAGIIAAGTGLTLVSSTQIITAPLVEADAYLDVCRTSIGTWWHWYDTGNYLELESALNKNVPVLKNIAKTVLPLQTTVSPLQKEAASLAVEAMIMQISLFSRNLKYSQRERHCYNAVQMGELSGDRNLLALAQYWYGDTFTYCYDQPLRAIDILNDALKDLGSSASVVRSTIYSDLSIAHAQDKDERNAKENEKLSRDYMEMARSAWPDNPELDPLFRCILHNLSELDQFDGKALLCLAERIPNSKYARQAYDLFEKSASQTASKGYLVQAIIRQADAARVLGYMDECVACLTNAYEKSRSISRLSQISGVISNMPLKWQKETSIQGLHKDITHAIVEYR